MKNWKSFVAFWLFLFLYAWTIFFKYEENIVETTGFIALYAMAFMMLRSEALGKVIDGLTEIAKEKLK